MQDQIDQCTEAIRAILPGYLKDPAHQQQLPSPDSTTLICGGKTEEEEEEGRRRGVATPVTPRTNEATPLTGNSPATPDLACKEHLEDESVLVRDDDDFCLATTTSEAATATATAEATSSSSRSSSPLSAVDIFTEFNAGVLRAVFEQGERAMEPGGSYSILVS